MRPDQYGILYLALTSRCNLACSYCPVPKAGLSMSRYTAERGIDVLLHSQVRELRFFGGEPLLEFELLKNLIERISQSGKGASGLVFRLTTNGTLLDDEKLDFIASLLNMQLVVSVDGSEKYGGAQRPTAVGGGKSVTDWFEKLAGRITRLKRPAVVNMVVCPQNAGALAENFTFLVRHGMRRINVLPAFYVEWSAEQLDELRRSFKKLAALIDRLWNEGFGLEIENLHVNVEKPLLSGGLLLDCDGEIYPGDAAMLFEPGPLRRRFSLGNIADVGDLDCLGEAAINIDDAALAERFSESALVSTRLVDAELSHFTAALKAVRRAG